MLNHIVLMGRLTRDPELRTTQSGVSVCSFSIACERDYADKATNERECDFIDCVAWRGAGEFVAKNFNKGRMICVSGRLQMRKWTDNDGKNRVSAEVVADNVYFADSKRPDGNNQTASNYAAPTDPVPADFAALTEADGYLPF